MSPFVRVRLRGTALVFAMALCACATTHPKVELSPTHAEPELVMVKHTVEPGQTIFRIARTYGLSADELMAANGIDDPRTLKVGQELVIPGAAAVLPVVPPGAQEASEEAALEGKPTPPREVSRVKVGDPRRVEAAQKGGLVLDWPVRGLLYAKFGKKGKEPHDGIDLAAPLGTPVKTAAPGQVLYAGEQQGYGLICIVQHEDDVITLYAHNRDLRVKTGQKVRRAQVIATVGDSGKTSGPHLHFEVRKAGVPVDPLLHLGAVPSS